MSKEYRSMKCKQFYDQTINWFNRPMTPVGRLSHLTFPVMFLKIFITSQLVGVIYMGQNSKLLPVLWAVTHILPFMKNRKFIALTMIIDHTCTPDHRHRINNANDPHCQCGNDFKQ